MSLPAVLPGTATVDVGGIPVEIRGLTRGEAMRMVGHAETPEVLEPELIAAATGTPLEEVIDWYQSVSASAVQPLVQAILDLSGMTEETGK